MRCEVIGFKPVKIGRYAIVRLVDFQSSGDIIGEVPVAPDSQAERGQIVELHIRPRVYQGRLEFSASVL